MDRQSPENEGPANSSSLSPFSKPCDQPASTDSKKWVASVAIVPPPSPGPIWLTCRCHDRASASATNAPRGRYQRSCTSVFAVQVSMAVTTGKLPSEPGSRLTLAGLEWLYEPPRPSCTEIERVNQCS